MRGSRFGGHDPIACTVPMWFAKTRAIAIASPKPGKWVG